MKCPRPDCKGFLYIQHRHSDMRPFIACTDYYIKGKPDDGCAYTESLTNREVELYKSKELTDKEVIELHYRIKGEG